MIPEAELERRLRQDPTADPRYSHRFAQVIAQGGLLSGNDRRRRSVPSRGATPHGLRAGALFIGVALLIVLALVVVGVGRRVVPAPSPSVPVQPSVSAVAPADLLARIRAAGVIRIAVRPDGPELQLPGAKGTFDEDIATEIASRLGVRAELIRLSTHDILADGPAATWDLALPSVADWLVPPDAFTSTRPYAYWPHYLLGPSGLTDDAIATGPICAVEGDEGAAWLRGTYAGTTASPVTAKVITKPTDTDCLGAIKDGDAVAMVTAGLTYVELGCTFDGCTNHSIPAGKTADVLPWREAPVEPRSAIARRGDLDPASLVATVDAAIDGMRADGRIHAISNAHFGPGRDIGYETGSAP